MSHSGPDSGSNSVCFSYQQVSSLPWLPGCRPTWEVGSPQSGDRRVVWRPLGRAVLG